MGLVLRRGLFIDCSIPRCLGSDVLSILLFPSTRSVHQKRERVCRQSNQKIIGSLKTLDSILVARDSIVVVYPRNLHLFLPFFCTFDSTVELVKESLGSVGGGGDMCDHSVSLLAARGIILTFEL